MSDKRQVHINRIKEDNEAIEYLILLFKKGYTANEVYEGMKHLETLVKIYGVKDE